MSLFATLVQSRAATEYLQRARQELARTFTQASCVQ